MDGILGNRAPARKRVAWPVRVRLPHSKTPEPITAPAFAHS
jgi:hypothetical protein